MSNVPLLTEDDLVALIEKLNVSADDPDSLVQELETFGVNPDAFRTLMLSCAQGTLSELVRGGPQDESVVLTKLGCLFLCGFELGVSVRLEIEMREMVQNGS